ncbi:YbfB/YjiJ family MFS transporter [soil metagenome]
MTAAHDARAALLAAARLALGAAIALGLARFAYALLLPPMRDDLGWSYTQAGALNTFNAVGYLIGALIMNPLTVRFGARRVFIAGTVTTTLLLLATGLTSDYVALSLLRTVTGVSSGLIFASGGLLAARLGASRGGTLLGIYYGGVGIGLIASAWIIPATVTLLRPHGWQAAWVGLAAAALLCTLLSVPPVGEDARAVADRDPTASAQSLLTVFWPALLGYLCFGFGYIGYMTFNVALLKQRGASPHEVTLFFTLIGIGALAGSKLWAHVLETFRGGKAFALVNAVVGIASLLPLISDAQWVFDVSGLLLGASFLAVVASTTALVRHSLAAHRWSAGIGLFTTVFAAGQIVGPIAVGRLSDAAGGLEHALTLSAIIVLAGSLIALRQRAFTGLD